ncbi:MAG: acetolactate synthase [Acidimicrobiia bacterium]
MAEFTGSGGAIAVEVVKRYGTDVVFTLSGAHVFPVYDACAKGDGVALVDTRHEQTATFAAEGYAKLTRRPGVAALTAGPGVTNGVSAVTSAMFNGSPLVVLGGRAGQARWGAGSLQELDHVPIMAPVTKRATTARSTDSVAAEVDATVQAALAPHRGPAFCDLPLDVVFGHATVELGEPASPPRLEPDPDDVTAVARLLARSERPVFVAGSGVWFEAAWDRMRDLLGEAHVPAFSNGLGRGTIAADDPLAFSRARSVALREADLVVVAGTPLDFRLGFGNFGGADVVHLVDHPDCVAGHVDLAAKAAGDLGLVFEGVAAAYASVPGERHDHRRWVEHLRDVESAKRRDERALLESAATPVHPARVYGELLPRLDRDAVVIGDGGDFVSYAGKFVDSYQPGCWLDPGPFGCLGTGPGYAMAARHVHPDRQVVLLSGDGGFGFSGLDLDTLVRYDLPVVVIVGNNGIWGLEKHPMQAMYGYDVACDLRQDTRYDLVMEALGGHGELVSDPAELGPALDRAFASGVASVVNVLTDPGDAYPRSSSLA